MARIGIIGGLGVGKAHAIAAINSGHTIAWVIDLPEKSYEVEAAYNKNGKGHITNKWGFIRETAKQENFIPILFDVPIKNSPYGEVDLIIISSPDLSHNHWATLLKDYKIIVEKPALISPEVYTSNTFVGYTWLGHSQIKMPEKHFFMFHCWPPNHRLGNIALDFGSHLLSVLFLNQQRSPVQLVHYDPECIIIEKDGVYGIGLYAVGGQQDSKYMGKSWLEWNMDSCDAIIDNKPIEWEELFSIQLDGVLNNRYYVKNMQDFYPDIDKALMKLLIQAGNKHGTIENRNHWIEKILTNPNKGE